MKRQEALRRFDALSVDGQQAVADGNLPEYLIAQDAETLIEQITEEIVLAGPDSWKHLQAAIASQDALSVGKAVLDACKSLIGTYTDEMAELAGYAQDWRDDAMAKRQRRVCGGLLPFDDDLGGRAA